MQATPHTAAQDDKPRRGRGTANPQPLHVVQIADALLTLRNAETVAGVSEATLYRKAQSDPTFPRLVKLGKRCTRIQAGALTAWLAAQAKGA